MEKAHSGEPIRYEGELPRHRHQGLGPPAPAGARDRADLHRRGARGDGADGGRRRRRADRPPDVLAALARRGPGRELRARARALGARALRLRLPADRLLRDRRRRGGAPTRPRAGRSRFYATVRTYTPLWEMHGFGDAARGGRRRVPRRRPRRDARGTSPTRWSTPTPPPARSTRCARGSRQVAERGDGILLTPPTYFIAPERDRRLPAADRRGVRPRASPRSPSTKSTNLRRCRGAARRGRTSTSFGSSAASRLAERRFSPGRGSGRTSARASAGDAR